MFLVKEKKNWRGEVHINRILQSDRSSKCLNAGHISSPEAGSLRPWAFPIAFHYKEVDLDSVQVVWVYRFKEIKSSEWNTYL